MNNLYRPVDEFIRQAVQPGAIHTASIANGAITEAKLVDGAAVAAILASGLAGSVSVVKTDATTSTIVAAHATKARACLVVVSITESYVKSSGTRATLKIGEDGTIEKAVAAATIVDKTAGTVLVFAFTNTATNKIIATTTAAIGDGTGAANITVLAIPAS
jgi:hypothetical protein